MKKCCFLALVIASCLALATAHAGTLPGSIARESLFTTDRLDWLSVGFNYEDGKREIEADLFGNYQAHTRSYAGYIGVDVLEWLTLFGTFGASEAQLSAAQTEFGDSGLKWSAGVNGNFWHHDVTYPDVVAGRLSIKFNIEYSKYNSSINGADASWNEITLHFPISYEISRDAPKNDTSDIFGVIFYAGPAVSKISGDTVNYSFNEGQVFGGVGGIDLYLWENISCGIYVELFDSANLGGNFRFHF